MASEEIPSNRPARKRVALGPRGRRLSFERRLRHKLWAMGLPAAALAAMLLWDQGWVAAVIGLLCVAAAWAIVVSLVMESIVRPLQTLANVIAALREDDFSFRARGGRRNDAIGDLAIEVNALAGMLQGQRGSAMEAVALAERVMSAMQTPVLAFDGAGRVQMLNPAAERTFGLRIGDVLGRSGAEVGLDGLLIPTEEESVSLGGKTDGARWVVKRTGFRMRGVPHVLVVLSEVSGALREEERNAWRRLVRVMGHEINNSLTPIKSIAGSLRGRLPMAGTSAANGVMQDLDRGLGVIENRAESLNRFLQAYRQLSGLPRPRLATIPVGTLVDRVAHLERGVAVQVQRGREDVRVAVDEDQVQQALINLVKNAVEAALGPDALAAPPEVAVGWGVERGEVVIWVLDNGPGITNPDNLFVPFYTTKPQGTGIGLALALQIAEAHQGTVRLTNRIDGHGCRAELRLPFHPGR
jgi:two-component system nitrogen regulation sensor histidine kinase NtrY